MRNIHRVVFSITVLSVTGAMLGMYFGVFVPNIIADFSFFSVAHKIVQIIVLLLYCFLAVFTALGNYIWLRQGQKNIFLRILTVLFCISIGIDGMKFHFLPFSFDLNLGFRVSDTYIQLGVNFLGVIFVFWYNFIRDME